MSYVPLILSALLLLPQAPAQDVKGWANTKWDMTLAEVKQAVEYPIESDAKGNTLFRIARPLEIESVPVRVTFEFPEGKLKFVTLSVKEDYARNLAFDSLKDSLIRKYGKPSDQDSKIEHPVPGSLGEHVPAQHRTAVWSFPSTSIILDWMEYGDMGHVSIIYRRAEKKDLL
jgi:hypothetical protein